jgi:hypothetical protein
LILDDIAKHFSIITSEEKLELKDYPKIQVLFHMAASIFQ